jgi:hypothetical protein
MSEFGNQQAQFYHISRHAELVFVKDRDVVAFWPDMPPFNPGDSMDIYRGSGEQFLQYGSQAGVQLEATERILMWARMSGDEIVGGVRWVPYIISNDIDEVDIRPLREVIAPRVVYDRTSNTLSLWFWTNVKDSYTGMVYDEDELYPVTAQDGYQTGFQSNDRAKRVLCYAIGEFYHSYVEGGVVSGYQSTAQNIVNNRWDLVPVFARPRIINWTQNDSNAAGVAVDGLAGIQVRLLHDMRFTGGTFQARYKDVMVLADLYTTDWVDIFLTATCPTSS